MPKKERSLSVCDSVKQVLSTGQIRYGYICNIGAGNSPIVRWDDEDYTNFPLSYDGKPWGHWSKWEDLHPLTKTDEKNQMLERDKRRWINNSDLVNDAWVELFEFRHGKCPI